MRGSNPGLLQLRGQTKEDWKQGKETLDRDRGRKTRNRERETGNIGWETRNKEVRGNRGWETRSREARQATEDGDKEQRHETGNRGL
jgi:hypothetical protein